MCVWMSEHACVCVGVCVIFLTQHCLTLTQLCLTLTIPTVLQFGWSESKNCLYLAGTGQSTDNSATRPFPSPPLGCQRKRERECETSSHHHSLKIDLQLLVQLRHLLHSCSRVYSSPKLKRIYSTYSQLANQSANQQISQSAS